jgi:hypothetical protein
MTIRCILSYCVTQHLSFIVLTLHNNKHSTRPTKINVTKFVFYFGCLNMNTNISIGLPAYSICLHNNEWHNNCKQWITKAVEVVTVCFRKCLGSEKSTCPLNHYFHSQDWQYWEFLFTCTSQFCLEVTSFLTYQTQYLKREGIKTKTKWLYDYRNSTWA